MKTKHTIWEKLSKKYPRLLHEDRVHYTARLIGAEFYERQMKG